MVRKILIAASIIMCALLQCSVFSMMSVLTVTPNLLLAISISFAIMCGSLTGMTTGFAAGLALDVLSGGVYGFYALIFMTLGYLAGFLNKIYNREDIKFPLFVIAVCDIFYGFIMYLILHFFRGDFQIQYYFLTVMLPELVFTVLVMIVLFPVILRLDQSISKRAGKNAKKFV